MTAPLPHLESFHFRRMGQGGEVEVILVKFLKALDNPRGYHKENIWGKYSEDDESRL